MLKQRFLLILLCFIAVVLVPWRTETVLPAEIIAISQVSCINQLNSDKLKNLKTSFSHSVLIDDQSNTVVMLNANHDSNLCKILTTENIKLNCNTSASEGMEISSGQDAIFFPESDQINPFHISLQRLYFSNGITHISGTPLKINQYFEGAIKGLISIKGDRKSLFMRAYNYLFHS
jgi:hypothetical protein